jgi:hypothetical protein
MKQALDILSTKNSKIGVKAFKNDMIMIHTSILILSNHLIIDQFSLESLTAKTKEMLKLKESLTLNEFSEQTRLKNLLLAKIIIEQFLDSGNLVIDESDLEVRYFLNKFINI